MDPIIRRRETMNNYSILSSTFTSLIPRQEDESCNNKGRLIIMHSTEQQQLRKKHSLQQAQNHSVHALLEENHNSKEPLTMSLSNHQPLPFPMTKSSCNPTLKHNKVTYSPFCSQLTHKPIHLNVLDASYSSSASTLALSPPLVVGSTTSSARTPNSNMSPTTTMTTTHPPPPSLFGNGYNGSFSTILSRNHSSSSSMNSSIITNVSRNSSFKSISSFNSTTTATTITPKNPKTKMLIGLDQIVQRSNSKAVKNALSMIQQACNNNDDDDDGFLATTKSSTNDKDCVIMADRDDNDMVVVVAVHYDNNNINNNHTPTSPLPVQPQPQPLQPPLRELEFLVQLAQADAYYRVIIKKYKGIEIITNALQRFDSTTTTMAHSEWLSKCQLLLDILRSSNHGTSQNVVTTRSHNTVMTHPTTNQNATFT